MMLVLVSQTKVRVTPSPRPKSRVLQQFRCGFGLPGRCARVAGEMCKGAKVKSTPSPWPGVCQLS